MIYKYHGGSLILINALKQIGKNILWEFGNNQLFSEFFQLQKIDTLYNSSNEWKILQWEEKNPNIQTK